MIEKPVTKCDSGTQTDTHFIESNIVKSYEWNEWELRRKAIKLVSASRLLRKSIVELTNLALCHVYVLFMILTGQSED